MMRLKIKSITFMEQTTIIDCYETKLKSEPQYEKYTPTNFATFLAVNSSSAVPMANTN